MVSSSQDIWILLGGAAVLLRLRNEVREGTDACVSVSRVFGPFNFCFRHAYAVLSHTRPKLCSPIFFIPKELGHALRQLEDELELYHSVRRFCIRKQGRRKHDGRERVGKGRGL